MPRQTKFLTTLLVPFARFDFNLPACVCVCVQSHFAEVLEEDLDDTFPAQFVWRRPDRALRG